MNKEDDYSMEITEQKAHQNVPLVTKADSDIMAGKRDIKQGNKINDNTCK